MWEALYVGSYFGIPGTYGEYYASCTGGRAAPSNAAFKGLDVGGDTAHLSVVLLKALFLLLTEDLATTAL